VLASYNTCGAFSPCPYLAPNLDPQSPHAVLTACPLELHSQFISCDGLMQHMWHIFTLPTLLCQMRRKSHSLLTASQAAHPSPGGTALMHLCCDAELILHLHVTPCRMAQRSITAPAATAVGQGLAQGST
jgi:hypothetical protein